MLVFSFVLHVFCLWRLVCFCVLLGALCFGCYCFVLGCLVFIVVVVLSRLLWVDCGLPIGGLFAWLTGGLCATDCWFSPTIRLLLGWLVVVVSYYGCILCCVRCFVVCCIALNLRVRSLLLVDSNGCWYWLLWIDCGLLVVRLRVVSVGVLL